MGRKKTTEQFIEEARKVHGSKYDYSKVEYKDAKSKVRIICHEKDGNGVEHGEFLQTPDGHLSGRGCRKCGWNIVSLKQRRDATEFIEKARKIHGDKYDYSKINYINNHTKVCIICPIHGEFMQTPHHHLQGKGCPRCIKKATDTHFFIEEAIKVHGNKYDYSKVVYRKSNQKVCIICHEKDENGNEHGEFWQTPNHHLNGCGCKKCSVSHLENKVLQTLNANNIEFTYEYSIGDKQTLDFYLPQYNIGIECQGIQHFKPTDFGGKGKEWARQRFLYIKKLDTIKKQKCVQNKIKLLYFANLQYDTFLGEPLIKDENKLLEEIYKTRLKLF